MTRGRIALGAVLLAGMLAALPASGQKGLTGSIGLEARGFARAPSFAAQEEHAFSVSASPEYFTEWSGGSQRLVLAPFARLDASDAERTRFDVREAYWQWFGERLEFRVGAAQVFWGVAESQHLVDIVNQTDGAERPDGEAKLGQPMVHGTWIGNTVVLDIFVMPFFRGRTFPGLEGRLRTPSPLDSDGSIHHKRVDVAARAFGTVRSLDLAVSGFWGTSREPRLGVQQDGSFSLLYPTIRQVGLEAQYTRGAWLIKSETILRSGWGDTFAAAVAGLEYTLGDLRGTGRDLGLLAEYHYDGREAERLGDFQFWTTPFRRDVFAGLRLAMNDVQSTELLAGVIIDQDTGETAGFVEGSRRIGSRLVTNLELRTFHWTDSQSPLGALERDDYLQLGLAYHF